MPNINTDLFDLVKTLSKKEKESVMRHVFKYKKEGGNVLMRLFKLLDKQKKYNGDELKKEINNLPRRKKELWRKILLVLRTNEGNIEMIKRREKLDFIHILSSRKLYKPAARYIDEMKNWSDKYGQYYYKGLTLQYESNLAQYLYNDNLKNHTTEIRENILQNAKIISLTAHAYEFYTLIAEMDRLCVFPRTPALQNKVRKLMTGKLSRLNTKDMSLLAKTMYLDAKAGAHYILRDFEAAYKIEKEIADIQTHKPRETIIDWQIYKNTIVNRFNVLDNLHKFEEWVVDLQEYKRVIDKYFNDDGLSMGYYHINKFWYHYRFDKFKSARRIISETETFYNQDQTKELKEIVKALEWGFVIAFFDLEDFDKAWGYCSNWVNLPPDNLMPDVQEFMHLFMLFILLGKKEYSFLAVKVKQYEKNISDKPAEDYAFDRLVIAFIKKMVKDNDKKLVQKEHFAWLHEKTNELLTRKHIYTMEICNIFNFAEWALSKSMRS